MLRKAATSVLRSVLHQPSLVLIALLVVPVVLFFNGPKVPPILPAKNVQTVQSPQRAVGGLCTPGLQRSRCLGTGIGGQPCHFYSCETCGSDGRGWSAAAVSTTPCAVPISHYVAVDSDAAADKLLPPWHALVGDGDEP